MKKSELLKLIETLGDEDNVIDTLKDHEEIKDLAKSFNMSLEDFKELLANNETIKGYWTGEKDRAVSIGINGYEEKTLPKKIQEALDKADNKNKTPEQIELENLRKEIEAEKKLRIKSDNSSKYTKILSEKGVDSRVLDFIYDDTEEGFNKKLETLTEIINTSTNKEVDKKLGENIYTPPAGGGKVETTLGGALADFYK
ncbi:MAG: capsid assembly scaffolding protein Gp46 family protein [Filifactoraceae bacterium]